MTCNPKRRREIYLIVGDDVHEKATPVREARTWSTPPTMSSTHFKVIAPEPTEDPNYTFFKSILGWNNAIINDQIEKAIIHFEAVLQAAYNPTNGTFMDGDIQVAELVPFYESSTKYTWMSRTGEFPVFHGGFMARTLIETVRATCVSPVCPIIRRVAPYIDSNDDTGEVCLRVPPKIVTPPIRPTSRVTPGITRVTPMTQGMTRVTPEQVIPTTVRPQVVPTTIIRPSRVTPAAIPPRGAARTAPSSITTQSDDIFPHEVLPPSGGHSIPPRLGQHIDATRNGTRNGEYVGPLARKPPPELIPTESIYTVGAVILYAYYVIPNHHIVFQYSTGTTQGWVTHLGDTSAYYGDVVEYIKKRVGYIHQVQHLDCQGVRSTSVTIYL